MNSTKSHTVPAIQRTYLPILSCTQSWLGQIGCVERAILVLQPLTLLGDQPIQLVAQVPQIPARKLLEPGQALKHRSAIPLRMVQLTRPASASVSAEYCKVETRLGLMQRAARQVEQDACRLLRETLMAAQSL